MQILGGFLATNFIQKTQFDGNIWLGHQINI